MSTIDKIEASQELKAKTWKKLMEKIESSTTRSEVKSLTLLKQNKNLSRTKAYKGNKIVIMHNIDFEPKNENLCFIWEYSQKMGFWSHGKIHKMN